MKKRCDSEDNWETMRDKISGLGERSFRKSYYPKLQEQLADRERLANYLRLLLDSTDEGIYGIDLQARCILVNRSGAMMVGYRPEDLLGKNIHKMIHHSFPDGTPYPVDECQIVRAIRNGQGVRIDSEVFWRRDGTSFPVEYSSYPIIEEGEIKGAVVTFVNITARKQSEQEHDRLIQEQAARAEAEAARAEIERRAAELDTTITAIADGIIIYSPTGEIVRMNPAAENILGFTPGERLLSLEERMPLLRPATAEGKPFPVEEHPVYRAFRGEVVKGVVIVAHRPDRTIWVSVSAAPILAPDGRLLGVVSVTTDVTALHELQEQREDILRTVSHDLRNPLTIITGQAQLLLRSMEKAGLAGTEHHGVEAILTSARRMNNMIQDLVDSARLEAGQLRIEKRPVDLRTFVHELLDRSKALIVVERIKVEMPADLPPVSADSNRLERIFTNLLSNALKHSLTETEVLVRAERIDNEVMVSVTDRGVGIAPEDLSHIFERFYTVKGGRKAEGVGLGLYITKMLVEAHGGRIWVESRSFQGKDGRGKGSTFYFTLPLA